MKDATDTAMSATYFDLNLEIDSGGRLRTLLLDYFNFPILNFSFIRNNIPATPAYEVYTIYQLILWFLL